MKVIVTKDKWGVQVWKEDADVSYSKRLNGKESIWTNDKIKLFRSQHALSNSFVKKNFPELGKDMENGEKKKMELLII